MHISEQDIFKAYDIRGIYPKQLDEHFAYLFGKAFCAYLNAKSIAVGQDMRESSTPLKQALCKGMMESGAHIIDIGLCTTPMINFASGYLEVDGAIMVTASHNPAEFNGFKCMRKEAHPIGKESGLLDIKRIMEEKSFIETGKPGNMIQDESSKMAYIQKMVSHARPGKRLSIVIDCANGMGAIEMGVLKQLSDFLDIDILFEELDGDFPNHEANPLKYETLHDLQKRVREKKAHLGIAFDGDADRCGFVDEHGHVIDPSSIACLIAQQVLKEKGSQSILYDLRLSRVVEEVILASQGKAIQCRVGHAYIKEQMRKDNAVFAAELSGHYYFIENFFAESSSLAILYMLNALWEEGKQISELIAPFKKYTHSGEINIQTHDKDKILNDLQEKYADGVSTLIDGVKISYDDWWFSVRKSNTEDLLRFVIEADTQELLNEKQKELLSFVK